jgi:hypothetical protein
VLPNFHGRLFIRLVVGTLLTASVAGADAPTITQKHLEAAAVKARALVEKQLGVTLDPGLKVRSAEPAEIENLIVEELTPRYIAEMGDPTFANHLAIEIARVLPRTMLGKFLAKDNEILILRGNFKNMADRLQKPEFASEGVLYAALLHEFVHAADEQKLGWSKKLAELHGAQVVAYGSVIDGHAQNVTRQICAANGWTEGFEMYRIHAGQVPREEMNALQIIVKVQLVSLGSTSIRGERFIAAIRKGGGEEAVQRALYGPPLELEIVYHPEWFLHPEARNAPSYDFEEILKAVSEFLGRSWRSQFMNANHPQFRAALSDLPVKVVDRVMANLKNNRVISLRDRENPKAAAACTACEFSSPVESLHYFDSARDLHAIKERNWKIKNTDIDILHSEKDTIESPTWRGAYSFKTMKRDDDSVVSTTFLVVSGSLVLEFYFMNVQIPKRKLGELTDKMFARSLLVPLKPSNKRPKK